MTKNRKIYHYYFLTEWEKTKRKMMKKFLGIFGKLNLILEKI